MKAMKIAFDAHKEQVDKAGLPYIFHPYHLAEQMATEDETCVALLHDVIEDTDITLGDLRSRGFPESIIHALSLLTHDDNVDYMEYIGKIKTDPIATKVKLADLRHNRNKTRHAGTDLNLQRLIKYQKAILMLYDVPTKESDAEPLVRERTSLDDNRLWFLSVFRNKNSRIIKYSFDVEKAGDSHYELLPEEFNRLAVYFGNEDMIGAFKKYIDNHSERDFVSLLDMLEIFYQPYHYA
jgi:hypothetical protein